MKVVLGKIRGCPPRHVLLLVAPQVVSRLPVPATISIRSAGQTPLRAATMHIGYASLSPGV
jgi:hypothetical protein